MEENEADCLKVIYMSRRKNTIRSNFKRHIDMKISKMCNRINVVVIQLQKMHIY